MVEPVAVFSMPRAERDGVNPGGGVNVTDVPRIAMRSCCAPAGAASASAATATAPIAAVSREPMRARLRVCMESPVDCTDALAL